MILSPAQIKLLEERKHKKVMLASRHYVAVPIEEYFQKFPQAVVKPQASVSKPPAKEKKRLWETPDAD